MKWLLSIVVLDLVYLLTLGTLSSGDAVVGAALAVLFTWASGQARSEPRTAPSPAWAPRIAWAPALAAVVLLDVLRNALSTLLAVTGRRAQPAVVEVPIGDRSPAGVAVTAFCTTASPGSVFLEVDEERRMMRFHYVDGGDPDRIRRRQAHFYATWQRRVFP